MEIWTQMGQETSLRQQREIAEAGKEEKEKVKALFPFLDDSPLGRATLKNLDDWRAV